MVWVQVCAVVACAREQQPVFRVEGGDCEAGEGEPAALANEWLEYGNGFAGFGVAEGEVGGRGWQGLAFLNNPLREGVANAVEVGVFDVSAAAVGALGTADGICETALRMSSSVTRPWGPLPLTMVNPSIRSALPSLREVL